VSLTTTTDQLFARRVGTLWRDTGLHVLALPTNDPAEVVVLGGGSAVLWRMLQEPLDLPAVMSRLRTFAGETPEASEVRECLDDLVHRGLVEAGRRGR